MEKKWNYLLNGLGVAIIGILLGSNVEYAANNYGILTHNLSYAVLSSTATTGGGLVGYIDIETYSARGTDSLGHDKDSLGNPIIDYKRCPVMFTHGASQAWALYKIKTQVEDGETFSIKIGEITYTSSPFSLKEGEKFGIAVASYELPVCLDDPLSCCYELHPSQEMRNLAFFLE